MSGERKVRRERQEPGSAGVEASAPRDGLEIPAGFERAMEILRRIVEEGSSQPAYRRHAGGRSDSGERS